MKAMPTHAVTIYTSTFPYLSSLCHSTYLYFQYEDSRTSVLYDHDSTLQSTSKVCLHTRCSALTFFEIFAPCNFFIVRRIFTSNLKSQQFPSPNLLHRGSHTRGISLTLHSSTPFIYHIPLYLSSEDKAPGQYYSTNPPKN